ncbi:MAG: hypothetical protein ACYSUI_03960 [Planctomycetota bacterium]
MDTKLPFEIHAEVSDRGLAVFSAELGGKPITSERYAPGDGDRRRRTAKAWADDSRLQNGEPVPSYEILAALEQAEFQVRDRVGEIQNQADDESGLLERASCADDDLLVELAWHVERARPDFIVYDRYAKLISRTERVDTAIGTIVPPAVCSGIVTPGGLIPGSLLVPTDCDGAGADEGTLRRDMRHFIDRYVQLPGDTTHIAVEYVLLSWVFDRFDEMPYLAFRTMDVGRGKSRALEVVGSLCYRAMFVGGGSSAAATLRLLDSFGGTLLADEFDQGHNTELAADLNRILNQGFQANRPLVKCDGEDNRPRPFRCFGPKLFALRKRLGDDATESRTLSLWMQQRTRGDIPLSLPRQRFDQEALLLRNRLLGWRFARYGEIAIDPTLADPALEDRGNQIGLSLLSVACSAEARQRIIGALRDQQTKVAADRGDSLAGEVFSIVVESVKPGDDVRPGKVAREVNRRRAGGEGIDLDKLAGRRRATPHQIGKILRDDLELPRLVKDRDGARYRLDPARMEQLCQRFGVNPPATSQGHTLPTTSHGNRLFDSASGACDVGDDGGVTQGVADLPDDDSDSDAAERAAIQAVEQEEEQDVA